MIETITYDPENVSEVKNVKNLVEADHLANRAITVFDDFLNGYYERFAGLLEDKDDGPLVHGERKELIELLRNKMSIALHEIR